MKEPTLVFFSRLARVTQILAAILLHCILTTFKLSILLCTLLTTECGVIYYDSTQPKLPKLLLDYTQIMGKISNTKHIMSPENLVQGSFTISHIKY